MTFQEGPLFRGDDTFDEYLDTLDNIECEENYRRTEAIRIYRQAYKIKGDLDELEFFKFGDATGGPGGAAAHLRRKGDQILSKRRIPKASSEKFTPRQRVYCR